MKFLKVAESNQEDRMNFVIFWANFVRSHDDKVWGEQHKRFINSMMQNAKYFPLTVERYLKLKGEDYSGKK